jgi:hypothetical protein
VSGILSRSVELLGTRNDGDDDGARAAADHHPSADGVSTRPWEHALAMNSESRQHTIQAVSGTASAQPCEKTILT